MKNSGTYKKCIICNKNRAVIPDRNSPGRPIKKLCESCHNERLRNDLKRLL